MCGICGTAGFADQVLLKRMTDIITHRGPDDHGIYVSPDGQCGLGNCRLSIIDLSSAGHMPMTNDDGSIWITYNGETYNFPALRAELEGLGYRFRSHTDTEVILRGYEAWGIEIVKRLNGMFAFALLDRRGGGETSKPILYLARDRFGIKPLYYTQTGGRLIFGSEIKSILLTDDARRGVNLEALHRYLAFGWVTGPETLFGGILKLPPGSYLRWQGGQSSVHSYWDLRFDPQEDADERALVAQLRVVFRRAVERHLISDVPLGVFLSGGLDSSAILAETTRITGEPVTAYTIAYRPEDGALEQSVDDPKYARLVARHFGAEYHEIVVDPDIVDLLPKVVWHLDEPVADAAAVATYLICKAARSQLKVLLSGQGGDEVFAGYRLHLSNRLANLAKLLPALLRESPARAVLAALPRIKNRIPGVRPGLVLALHRYFDRLLAGASLSPEQRYIFYRSYYTDSAQQQLYSRDLSATLADQVAGERHLEYFSTVSDEDFLNQMLYVDAKTFLPELNLTYSDKLSSAASVEVRVPFLDNELIELAASLPPHLKLHGLTGKYILKKAMEGILPHSVIYRRKAGFGAPIRTWLRRDLREMVDDLLSEQAIRRRGYFEPAAIRQLVERDRDGTEDNSYRIWALLTLELWHRSFVDAVVTV